MKTDRKKSLSLADIRTFNGPPNVRPISISWTKVHGYLDGNSENNNGDRRLEYMGDVLRPIHSKKSSFGLGSHQSKCLSNKAKTCRNVHKK